MEAIKASFLSLFLPSLAVNPHSGPPCSAHWATNDNLVTKQNTKPDRSPEINFVLSSLCGNHNVRTDSQCHKQTSTHLMHRAVTASLWGWLKAWMWDKSIWLQTWMAPLSWPVMITLFPSPGLAVEKATEQILSGELSCPIRLPFIDHKWRVLLPSWVSSTTTISPCWESSCCD